jgi:hypothetical protein
MQSPIAYLLVRDPLSWGRPRRSLVETESTKGRVAAVMQLSVRRHIHCAEEACEDIAVIPHVLARSMGS